MISKRLLSLGHRRGVVLLLVIGAVAILAALAVEVAHRSQLDVSRTARSGRDAAFRRDFDSGLAVAKGLLAEKRTSANCDYWGDGWHKELKVELAPGERLALRLEDEAGKLSLQKVASPGDGGVFARKSLERLFENLRKNDPQRERQWDAVELSLRKRLGLQDEPKDGTLKKEEKAPLKQPPTPPKTAPLYTLDGLREAGIPLEMVFGQGSFQKPFPDRPALCDLLTTFGDGLVNLNTAPEAVLYALDEEYDEGLVDRIAAWRGKTLDMNAQSAFRPFRQPKDLEFVEGIVQRAVVDGRPQVIKNLLLKVQTRVTVLSHCFSVRMLAEVEGRTRMGWGFFEVPPATEDGTPAEGIKLLAFEELEP
ncbi:MAG: general secretion pathway protein GspK [Planctomycetes bacterium]|nr:general secretion pathway protein GspK [Planctomycetota bacterium]